VPPLSPIPRRVLLALASAAATSFAGCSYTGLPPSIWPPANFALEIEELRFEGDLAHVVRRARVDAQGVFVYGTASRHLVDAATGASLPVFDRLAVYQLEPECLRALSRKVAGLVEGLQQGEPGEPSPTGVVLRWRAFDTEAAWSAQGRPRGRFHEVVKELAGYLPKGEAFATPVRGARRVLRGVPAPKQGAAAALAAYEQVVELSEDDDELLLDAFALACDVGDRSAAERWLERWTEATADERASAPAFRDGPPALSPAVLQRLLPPAAGPSGGGG